MKLNQQLIQDYFDLLNSSQYIENNTKKQLMLLSLIVNQYVINLNITNVVDVASGTGAVSETIEKLLPEAHYYLLDLSLKSLGQSKYPHKVQGDGQRTPFCSEWVDLLLCRQGLHYMDLREALHDFRRLLRPNGIALICTEWWFDGDENDEEKRWLVKVAQSRSKPPHYLINKSELLELLSEIGFEIICSSFNFEKKSIPVQDWVQLYSDFDTKYSDMRKKILDSAPSFSKKRGYPIVVNEKVEYISKWMVLVCQSIKR